jgi:hypothetical protein
MRLLLADVASCRGTFHEKTYAARLAEVVNAQSPSGLCGLVGRSPRPSLAMSIFARGGRGEAAGQISDGKLSIGIDVSVKQRCSHRPSCSMVSATQGSTTTAARFSAFSGNSANLLDPLNSDGDGAVYT